MHLIATAALCASFMQAPTGQPTIEVTVDADGALWALAEAYAASLGGYSETLEAQGIVTVCVGERCIPLRIGESARLDGDAAWIRVDRAARIVSGDPAGPATGLSAGDRAPSFTLKSLAGDPVSLEEYRGRKLLVFAWASW
jgi:hypothetical protein